MSSQNQTQRRFISKYKRDPDWKWKCRDFCSSSHHTKKVTNEVKAQNVSYRINMSRNTDSLMCFQSLTFSVSGLLFWWHGQFDHVSRVWQRGNFPLSLGNMSQAAIIAMATHSSIPQPLTMADARCAKRSGGVLDRLQNPIAFVYPAKLWL